MEQTIESPALVALSGFNPFDRKEWYLDSYYVDCLCPHKRNWTEEDGIAIGGLIINSIGPIRPFVLTLHSDAGTIGHRIANCLHNCIGLHCHAATFSEPVLATRDFPRLITQNTWDLTCMKRHSDRANEFYQTHSTKCTYTILPRKTWHGHEYSTCIPTFLEWCQKNFNWQPEVKHENL